MTMITNNLPTKQLQALDAAHHMHPFTANAELAKKLLADSGVSIISADSFEDAAIKAVDAAKG